MKQYFFTTLLAVFLMVPSVYAATQTVTLNVPDMNCASCPITVKKALSRVDGVGKIEIDLPKKEVVVVFDDAKTTVAKLTHATEQAGYSSSLKK